MHPNNTFNFILPNTSLSLSSIKNNIKFKKLDIDIKTLKYPKSSLRSMNNLIEEAHKVKKFKQEAGQILIYIKNEEIKTQQIRKERLQRENKKRYLNKYVKKSEFTYFQPNRI